MSCQMSTKHFSFPFQHTYISVEVIFRALVSINSIDKIMSEITYTVVAYQNQQTPFYEVNGWSVMAFLFPIKLGQK